MAAWRAWCKSRELSPLVGALAIAKGMTGVKCAVVGVDSVSQLKEIVSAWRSAPVLEDTTVACADEKLIDPRQWRMA
jgi:aryl-alcohol dehydrogenase-like predicted oxidoreductase